MSSQMAFADRCPHLTIGELYEQSSIVFQAQVMDAVLMPAGESTKSSPSIRANFEVIETYRGNPGDIPYLVSRLDAESDLEPRHYLAVGQSILVFARQSGEYSWDRCSTSWARVDDCEVYELQQLSGIPHAEDRNCETAMLWGKFNARGIHPSGLQWDDLEGLEKAWKEMFGEEP